MLCLFLAATYPISVAETLRCNLDQKRAAFPSGSFFFCGSKNLKKKDVEDVTHSSLRHMSATVEASCGQVNLTLGVFLSCFGIKHQM